MEKLKTRSGHSLRFRGVCTAPRCNGAIICGELFHNFIGTWIRTDAGELEKVDPEKLDRYIGSDEGGHEVYEGDKLIARDGTEYTAALTVEFTCEEPRACDGKAYFAGGIEKLKVKAVI